MYKFFALTAMVVLGLSSLVATAAELSPGDAAPEFGPLEGVDGKNYSTANTKRAKALVIVFTCNECPVAIAYQEKFNEFAKKYSKQGVAFIAINSNNATENLAAMKEHAEKSGFAFPYVFDKSGEVADAFGAKVTPHVFVLDAQRKLVFSGPFDNKQTGATKHFVDEAVTAALAGKTPEVAKARPFGCSIHKTK
ncbi:MAG: thioredoxin family protein [Planctomycetaceae bacterium]